MSQIYHRDDDYIPCSYYEGHTPNNEGFSTFAEEGKFYFAYGDEGHVILRSEGYSSEAGRDNGIASVTKNMGDDANYSTKMLPDGRWVLSLKAANHQEIARSCPVATEDEAKAFLPSARAAAKAAAAAALAAAAAATPASTTVDSSDRHEDDYLLCREYEEQMSQRSTTYPGFITFQHENQKHYFAWVSDDNKIILRGEGYPATAARNNGVESVTKNREIKERFSIEEKHGAYFLVLKAGNHQEIGRSCPQKSEADAWALIAPPKKEEIPVAPIIAAAAAAAPLVATVKKEVKEDDYLACEEYRGHAVNDKIHNIAFFKHKNGQFYFVVYNKDGSVRLRSEGFETAQERDVELSGVVKYINDNSMYSTIEKAGYKMMILKDKSGREVGRSCPEKIGVAVPPPVVAPPPPVAPVAALAPEVAAAKGFNWMWLLIPLLLLLLGWFWWKGCNTPKVEEPPVAAAPAPPVAVDTTKKEEPKPAPAAPSCDLHWIFFDYDKYNIRSDAKAELQKLAKILKENAEYTALLKGNTDGKGTQEYNQTLSENRCKSTTQMLVSLGIDAGRIKTAAASKNDPIAKNTDDDSGRKFNRRVELYVKDKAGNDVCKSIMPDVPENLKEK